MSRIFVDGIEPIAAETIRSSCVEASRLGHGEVFSQLADAFSRPAETITVDFQTLSIFQIYVLFCGFRSLATGLAAHDYPIGARACAAIAELCRMEALSRFDDKGRFTPALN